MKVALKGRIVTWGHKIGAAQTGRKRSPETVEKMRNRVVSEETRQKLRGRKHTPETIQKLRENRAANPGPFASPPGHTPVKVDQKYRKAHWWCYYNLGKAQCCTYCGRTDGRIEWANISKEYTHDPADWVSLCKKHHFAYDKGKLSLEEIRGAKLCV